MTTRQLDKPLHRKVLEATVLALFSKKPSMHVSRGSLLLGFDEGQAARILRVVTKGTVRSTFRHRSCQHTIIICTA
jgi:hypothetical protein